MAWRGCKEVFAETRDAEEDVVERSPAVSPPARRCRALLTWAAGEFGKERRAQRHLHATSGLFKVETARSSITGKMRKRTVSDKANACVNDHFKRLFSSKTGNVAAAVSRL